jgi:hypothetical protein
VIKISAYQAAMIAMGQNVDQFEIVERGSWLEEGEHMFLNTIFKNFVGETFCLEQIRNCETGELAREWAAENECLAVKQIMNEDGLMYVELEDEEPLQ